MLLGCLTPKRTEPSRWGRHCRQQPTEHSCSGGACTCYHCHKRRMGNTLTTHPSLTKLQSLEKGQQLWKFQKSTKKVITIKWIGVLQDTARAPQPPTDPTTGYWISLHGLAQIDQKCQIWAKNLFFTGEIKSFVTHISENPPRHPVHNVFWSGIGQNVQKMAIFGPKWPKMQILDQIWQFLGQKS